MADNFYAKYPVTSGSGGGVTHLDGMTGDITLVAGTGIGIVDGSGIITISSTATTGANTALSNLINPTAINQNLVFGTGLDGALKTIANQNRQLVIATGDSNASKTGDLIIVTGSAGATQLSGALQISTGNGTTSGDLTVQTGSGQTTKSGDLNLLSGGGLGGSTVSGGNVNIASGAAQSGSVGNVNISTGGSSGTVPGNITLTTGVASGNSSQGKIQLKDGSQGTSGQIWTSTDTVGSGHWAAAPATGANTTLSNLTSPTAVNQDLNLGGHLVKGLGAPSVNGDALRWDQLGANNGIATLDSGGKVPLAQLPPGIVEYKGTWSAATNTPTLADGTGTSGWFYICSAAGTVNFGSGAITFAANDWVIYNGTIWQKSINSNAVASVNGQTGTVTVNAINQLTGDVTAGPASGSASAAATIAAGAVTAAKLGTVTDGVTLDQAGSGSTLEIKTGGVGTAQLAATSVTVAKLGTITDGVTLDQSGSGSTLEVKTGGISNTQVNASAAIALTKLATTTASKILTSNVSGVISPTLFTAPAADGTSGQALVTNGSGQLSFATVIPPGFVGASYNISSTFTTSAVATIIFDSKVYDVPGTGAYNTTTGAFTVPTTGYYLSTGTFQGSVIGTAIQLKNNTSGVSHYITQINIVTGDVCGGSCVVFANVGDLLTFSSDLGGAMLNGICTMSISYIGVTLGGGGGSGLTAAQVGARVAYGI